MKLIIAVVIVALGCFTACGFASSPAPTTAPISQPIPNPAIDMPGYLQISAEAAKDRETHRLTEEQFLDMSRQPGVIVLDCRSKQKFDELHIAGAINLSFPDIAVESLARTLPDKNARILIYCNNNFRNAEKAFPSKLPSASLNISTYIALYNYGYRNVYELGPQLDPAKSILTFESTQPAQTPKP